MDQNSIPVWPPHDAETLPWQQVFRAGIQEDRMLRAASVSIPPTIHALDYLPPLNVLLVIEDVLFAIPRADTVAGRLVPGAGCFVIRAYSVASSLLEHINASTQGRRCRVSVNERCVAHGGCFERSVRTHYLCD